MTANQTIEVVMVDANGAPLPLSNVLVEVLFYTNGNYRYTFEVGRTDPHGHVRASYAHIEQQRVALGHHFVMDYNTTLENCDVAVLIHLPSEHELTMRSQRVKETYGAPPAWAAPWPSNGAIRAADVSVDLNKDDTVIPVVVEWANS